MGNGQDRAKAAVGTTIRRSLQTAGEGRGWTGPELQQCAEDRGGLDRACWRWGRRDLQLVCVGDVRIRQNPG